MAQSDSTSWDELPVLRDAIAASLGGAYWTVDDGGWPGAQPALLPDGYGDLLAAPVVVGAAPLGPDVDLPELLAAPAEQTPPAAPPAETVRPAADPREPVPAEPPQPVVAPAAPHAGRHRRVAPVG